VAVVVGEMLGEMWRCRAEARGAIRASNRQRTAARDSMAGLQTTPGSLLALHHLEDLTKFSRDCQRVWKGKGVRVLMGKEGYLRTFATVSTYIKK